MQQAAKPTIPRAQGVIAPNEVRERVAALVQAKGERAARERLNIGRQTLARIAGGLPVRVATLAYVQSRLGGPLDR